MCRLIQEMNDEGKSEQKVYGVLTDYDLSSWKKDLIGGYTRTSQQRTGTPPYMAQELLQGTSTTHLYRHDLESLFYIMLLMGGRHTTAPAKGGPDTGGKSRVVMREGARPYEEWFETQRYHRLGFTKEHFFLHRLAIELSPAFEDFRPWLRVLRHHFAKGFCSKNSFLSDQEELPSWDEEEEPADGSAGGASVTFDDETLGGRINYSAFIKPTQHLKGQLKGLVIRYKTTSPPLPTPAGAIQADA
jgi:hypothetical protein